MDRAEKAETVEALKSIFAGAGVVVVGHYAGLTVADMQTLRGRLRQAGAGLKVVKNRLAKRALNGAPGASALFEGPTAIAYSADPVAAPKVAAAYAKEQASAGAIHQDQVDPAAKWALEPFDRGASESPFKVQQDLQEMMQDLVGIVRKEDEMLRALDGAYLLRDVGNGSTEVTYRLSLDVSIPLIGMLKRKGEKILIDTALKGLKKRVESL